jgi:hypothetical protein
MAGGAATAQQQATSAPKPERHVRGIVVAVTGNTVEVRARGGETAKFDLGDKTFVGVLTKADPSAITKDAWIGTMTVRQPDGTLRALEVHIFPESARGTGEGQRPWDLQAGSSMTDAMVSGTGSSGAASSTMTNGSITRASKGANGLELSLKYGGGEQTVVVPTGTPITRVEPADRSRIVPGAHVFAVAFPQQDGTLVAGCVYVGKGVVPPM